MNEPARHNKLTTCAHRQYDCDVQWLCHSLLRLAQHLNEMQRQNAVTELAKGCGGEREGEREREREWEGEKRGKRKRGEKEGGAGSRQRERESTHACKRNKPLHS